MESGIESQQCSRISKHQFPALLFKKKTCNLKMNSTTSSPSQKSLPPSTPSKSNNTSFVISSTEQTPSVVKSECRNLLKKLDTNSDDVEAAEDLYTLSLFQNNRNAMIEIGALSNIVLALKTKSDQVKEVLARTLQLYAQDGGENCAALRRLGICKSCLELISRMDDSSIRSSLVGLVYWLTQNPACKKEFIDLGADNYLRELNTRVKDPILSKFLNYSINALNAKVKSREEMLEDILSKPLDVKSNAMDTFSEYNPYTSPKTFMNIFQTPIKQSLTISNSSITNSPIEE